MVNYFDNTTRNSMRNKIFIYLILFTIKCFAQGIFSHDEPYLNSSFIYFLPNSNDIACIISKSILIDSTNRKSFCENNVIAIFSSATGNIIKEIPLSEKENVVYAMNVSNDGNSLIVFTSFENAFDGNQKGPFLLKKYSLKEDRWEWEKEWYNNSICARMTFSEDDKQIICVTPQSTFIIDSKTGLLIKGSNAISSIIDEDAKYPRFALSKNGRYFAYWKAKYLTFSRNDESGFIVLADFLWYGIKWLFCLGSIPQYVYVWDIKEDKLYDQIRMPFEANKGTPAFTSDEKELLLGPHDSEYKVYSIIDKKINRSFVQNESIYHYPNFHERNTITCTDFKTISSDNKYFVACFELNKIFLIDYSSGNLLKKMEQSIHPRSFRFFDQYASTFSADGKYFAAITYEDNLCLYSTKTWEKIWERDDLYKWHKAK